MRLISACLLLTTGLAIAAEAPPVKPAASDVMSDRIVQLETEIRSLVAEQAKDAGVAGAAIAPDYTDAKARSATDVRRRLDIVEYLLADNDYSRAVDACNAILRDHPHEAATVRLKYRILMAMVERERSIIERNRKYRVEEALADVQTREVIPADKAPIARTVWIFDETLAESERELVRRRMQVRITVSYEGVSVGEVLKPLFAMAGLNYVILDRALSDDKLTLHLVDDTVENALSTVAKLVSVHYNYSGNTVYIGAADSDVMVNEIIHLQSGLTDTLTEVPFPPPVTTTSGGTSNSQPQALPPQSPNQPNQPPAMVSDLERFLAEVPTLIATWPTEGGRLYLDRKTNTLYVRATPAAITELRRHIRAMDYQSTQILIEARFVEVREDALRELGLDWGGGSLGNRISVSDGASGAFSPTGISGAGAAGPAMLGGGGLLASVLFSPKGQNSPGIFGKIQALESEEKAESLTEPRILTLNNSVGTIKLAETTSYIIGYDFSSSTTSTVTNTTGTTNVQTSNPTPKWETIETGITLRIRPSIARNSDIITLDVRPSITVVKPNSLTGNSVTLPASTNGGAPSNLTASKPDTITRALATTLHVQNGQTVVLGGQALDFVENSDAGVPGLRMIPVLGRLFSKEGKQVKRSNLLIFVTAHIIDPSGAKVGEEIKRLRDTASVVMPEELRAAEAEVQAVEAQRRDEAAAKSKQDKERKSNKGPNNRSGRD